MNQIILKPVGRVISSIAKIDDMPRGGCPAVVEIFPEYSDALHKIEENSYIWLLAWFHEAPRDMLRVVPGKINPELPEYGVFALRAFGRPNPVAMCLVKLIAVEGNKLQVEGLDAINDTPIIDIKPYFENDIVFSSYSSYVRGKTREVRYQKFLKLARTHHQEECFDLLVAARMALIAEEYFGRLDCPELVVYVNGSCCLGDCIQGLTRARLSNPPRFNFQCSEQTYETTWEKDHKVIVLKIKKEFSPGELQTLPDEELFTLQEFASHQVKEF